MDPVGIERVLTLEGGYNFRDMGGYATERGPRVKWRKLFRSGSMNAFTAAGYEQFVALGLKAVCDFRSTSERERNPTDRKKLCVLTYWARDYSQSLGRLETLLRSDDATPQEARETMLEIYRGLPAEQAPAYRQLFRLLAEGELPLVFNCSGGKDRTGLAAALVLTALGAPDDVVVEDYLLSNKTFGHGSPDKGYAAIRISPEVVQIIGGTNADFLDVAFSTIREMSGSVSGYLRRELGVTPEMLNQIHENLLEPSP